MSHPLYNPYASGNQSSSHGQYGHSSVPPERDPRRTSSHFGPGSNFSSSGVSSATPANSGGTIPSLLSLPVTYIPKQRRPVLDKEIEGSIDMRISRAREEVRHQPVSQGSCFTGTQTGGFASSSTGGISYPMPSASQGQRHSDDESGSSSLDWLQDYKRATEDDSSRYYSTSASCSFPGSDDSRFNASSGRERGMQSIPGLGDYDYPGPDKPAAPTESSHPKYTSESAANILLHFGLEKEDLEHLISFPENQITPDNLPFILRQIRIQKAKKGTTADQSKPYPEPKPTTSQSSSRGAGMHLDEMSSAVLQPSKVIDYGHTSKYTGGVVDEIGRTSDSRENSGGSGSMFQMNPYSSGSHKSGTSAPSRDPWGSGASLSSSYSSMQSSATPPSSDPTKRLKTQQDLTSQTTFSFPLPKKDTDIRLFKPEISNPLLTQESRPDKQPVSKTEPSDTVVRGGNTSRPGILRLDGHDKSSSKDQSSTKGQGLKVAEQIKKQQMQPKQSEPQPKQSGQQPKQPVQQPKQPVQQPKQPVQQPKQSVQQQSVQQQPVRQQKPVLQIGQMLQPQGFPAARPVPPPSFIPSSSSTSHSILPPVFVGGPRPLVVPPALPQPVPGLMNFLHMQMPPSSNQRGATGEVSRILPSAAMMHDYAAASPRIFPHTCTLCNKECSQMKDWISHQNTSIHLENCKLLRKRYPQWDGEVPSLPRAPGSNAKPSPSSSAQTYQGRHQRSGREIPSRSRSSRSRSRSYSPVRHHGSESRRNRRSSRSRSRSYSPRRYHGSESRREKRSRSRSPYSSRYTRRSRSNSPRYDRTTSSRYRSRSRSRERRSSPRRRDEKRRERRSSSERSSPHRKRSSSTEMLAKKLLQTTAVQSLSSQSDLETVVKTLAPALLAELAKMKSSSSSAASSSSSSNAAKKESTAKKAKSSLQKSEVNENLPPNEVKLQGVRTSLSHGDVVAAVEQFGKTKSVVLFRSKVEAIVRFEKAEDAEKLRSFNSINIKGMPVTIVREEKAAPLPTSAKEPTKPPEQKSSKSTQSTKSTNVGKSSSLPSAANKPKTGKLVAKAKVLVSKAKNQPTKQTVKKTKTGKVTAKGAVKSVDVRKGASKVVGSNKLKKPVKKPDAGVSKKEPEPKTSETSAKESVVAKDGETNNAAASAVKPVAELNKPVAEAKEVKSSESLELGETGVVEPMEVVSSAEGEGEKVTDTKPLPTKSSETHPPTSTVQTTSSASSPKPPTDQPEKPQPTVTTPETSIKAPLQVQQDTKPDPKSPAPVLETKTEALQPQQQTTTGSAKEVETKTNDKDAVTTQKDAAPTISVSSSSTEAAASSSPPVAKLTIGDEIEKHLLKERIPILKMVKLSNVKLFKLDYRVLLISNLPEYQDGCYTEQDVADLLVPFGFHYHEDSIYVIPQTRMAFAMMPTVQELKNIMRPSQKKDIFLHGSKISVEVMKQYILFEPIDFYKSLMKLMRSQPVFDNGTRTVFIRNISQSQAKDLREALKKIGSVRNFLPVLNKVFVEFDSIRDADRLGVWFSLLNQTRNYSLLRLEVPRSAITALPPRLAANAVPDSKDIVAGATVPTTRSGVPQGSTAPFWVTMRTGPFVFPTTSPWFIIPDYQTVDVAQDVGICSSKGMKFYTLMLTGLPEGNYTQEDVAKLVWRYFPRQNLHWLYYNVTVLTLQRRAFVYFSGWRKCREFIRDHIKSPVSVTDCTLKVHIVLEDIHHGSSEEVMYRNLMKWSNAHVPELESLEDRLLCVEISETTMDLIMLVMHVVSSIASFISFLPLANRVLIEMSEPSGVTKVVESASQHHLTAVETWSKVQRIETLKSLKQRLQDSSEVIINLGLDATDVSSSLPAVTCEAQPPPSNPDSAEAAVGSESITAAPADVEMKDSVEKPSAQVTVDSRIPPKDVEKEVKTSENKPRSEVSVDSKIPPKDVQKKSEQKPASEVTVDSRISLQDLEKSKKNPSAEVSVDSRIPPKDVEKEVKTSENKPRSEVSVDSRIPPENIEQEEVKKSEEKPASQVTVDSKIPPEKMDEVEVKDEASAAASVCSADANTVAAASSSDPSATREVKTEEAELPTINEDVFKVIAAAVRQHRLALRGGTPSEDREVQSSSRNSTSSRSVKSKEATQEKDPTDFTASVDSSDFFSLEEQTFNLEDFVTVDEIVDDDQSSSSSRRTSRDRQGQESSDAAKQASTRSSKDSKSSASSSSPSSKPTKASVRSSSSSSSKSASPKRHQDSSEPSRSHIKPSAAGRTSAEPPASSGHRAQPRSTKSPARASQSSSSGCRTRSAKTAAGSHQSHREEEKPTESAAAKSDHQVSAESAAAKTVESETETEASSEMLPPAQRQDSEVTNRTRSLQTDLKNESLKEVKMSKERKKEEADKHTEEQEEEEEEDYQILDSVDEQTDEQTTEENPDEAQSEQRLDDGGQQVLDRVEKEGGAPPEEGNASVRVLESITEDQEAAVQDDQRLMEVKQPTEKNPSRAVDGSDKSAAEDSADQNQDTKSRKSPRSRGRRTKDKEMPSEESCKASKDAGRSPDSEEKPPEGRDDKDASTDVSEQGTFEILDSVEDQTRTEGDDQKPTADTTTEEDLFQVIDSVEDQPEMESESNNKERRTKRGEAAAKRDDRPTRRTLRTRTSQSEDKEKSPKKADRTVRKHETRTKDSAAGKDKKEDEVETLKKMVDSVDGASTTERSGRRRTTRGNKEEKKTSSHSEATENPNEEEEIMYEILDSVEDEAAVDEPTVSTRSTRGRSQRTSRKEASNPTKDDTRRRRTPARDSQKPNEEKAAAKERTPMKKSGAGEEEATYETLDSVEDDQPLTGGKPRRGRPKKDVKTAKKPNKAAKEEEATYQVLDSVGDETVEDQHHTEESKSPRKSTVCEDDSRNTKKSSASMMDEEEEEPMYQIVDSLEDDQEEKTNTEESDGRTTERSWTKDEDPAAETGDLEPGGTSTAEPVEENLQQTAELHPAAAENKEQSPEPDEAPTENKQEAAAESSLNLDEVSEEEEDYPDDGTEEEELKKKKQAAVAMTTRMEADGQQLLTLDEVGGDGDGRRPEITEGELQELVTLDEICEEEEGKAELSVPEPRPLNQESQSEASSNPQAADEEQEKTSKYVKQKHEDDDSSTVLEQSVNFVTVDEVGDAKDEEKEEEKEAPTPRTRGRAKKRSRQSAVRKSTRGKTETPEEEGSMDSSAAQSDELLIQRTEVEAASGAQEEAASAGQQLEGCLEEKEGRSTDADNKRRKQLIGPEAKKPRCQSPGGEFSLPPFSSSPLGVEFVVPKSGFFCELCSVFYLNEISAKETHCSSQRHYHNLEKHYQKLKQKLSGTENPQSSD